MGFHYLFLFPRFGSRGSLSGAYAIPSTSSLPDPTSLKPIKDSRDAEQYLALGEAMISMAVNYGNNVADKDRKIIKTLLASINNKISCGLR